ncbi:type II toxin-antitoxin system Phd/YefM family antitoxin [Pseudogemmobacter sp. W21_MBD1_M6]|uniref:type II toxin-antitoxin system Phd/YefM family antitoxin n=1 Tax=Pseudogemmobacter sp. W21_MBD1_M6 TaxID=3240271 RepID=UPI003F9EA449
MQRMEANRTVSVSDLKRSPTAVINQAADEAVAVLNHNRVMAYMVPVAMYEQMMEQLDDLALIRTARARMNERPVPVALDEL